MMMIITLFLPLVVGTLIVIWPKAKDIASQNRREGLIAKISIATIILTLVSSGLLIGEFAGGKPEMLRILEIAKNMSIYLELDNLGAFFLGFIPLVWLLAGIFSLEYLHHEQNKQRFWGFYLLTLAALQGINLSGNLVTVYLFFEMMTLVSMPLVLHTQTHEAIMAGLKYLLYSMAGAYIALFGLFVVYHYGIAASGDSFSEAFRAGGILSEQVFNEHGPMLLIGTFCMILGFGVKAGLFPMHAWLPTAHPVAPAPASAVLSAIIVKGGVLALIRSVFYVIGADNLRGTWVQYLWMGLAAFTVFMGSMLAYNEKVLKKRLAYSSVSQASYILLGLSVFNPAAMTGALLHVLFHAFIKTALFLTAGAIIYETGKTRVDQLRGIGKEMPVTIWCYTFVSLALIGIPPASGFVSKWYLATGMLESGVGFMSWLGPVILLVSALLTAGYLLPITITGFLPGEDYDYSALKVHEPSVKMVLPLLVLAAGALVTGLFPGGLIGFLSGIAGMLV